MTSADRLRQITLTSSRLRKLIAVSHVPNQQAAEAFNTYRDLLRNTGAAPFGQLDSTIELAMRMRFMRVTFEIAPEDWLEVTMSDLHDLETVDDTYQIAQVVYTLADFNKLVSEWYQLLFKPATLPSSGNIEDLSLSVYPADNPYLNAWSTPWEIEATHATLAQGFPIGLRVGSIVRSDDYDVEHCEDNHSRPLSLSNRDYFTGAIQLDVLIARQTPHIVTMRLIFTALDFNTFDRLDELQSTYAAGLTFEFFATNSRFDVLAMELHRLKTYLLNDRGIRSLLSQRFPLISENALLDCTTPDNFPATVWLEDQRGNQLRIKSERILVSNAGTNFYQSFPVLELVPAKPQTSDRSFSCVLSLPHLGMLISALNHYLYLWHRTLMSETGDADPDGSSML